MKKCVVVLENNSPIYVSQPMSEKEAREKSASMHREWSTPQTQLKLVSEGEAQLLKEVISGQD